MTANQIVDKMLEAGPLDAGEFMSGFPTHRAGEHDLYAVIQKLLKLKEANGGQWSETGDINVSVFGGDPIENFRPEHATYDHFQKIIDFDGAVVDFNGEVIGQGIAQENPLDTFFGWQAYLDLTNEGPMRFAVTFGKNDVESGSFEPGLPPEVEETVRAHFNKFKEQFIDQVMWLEEGKSPGGITRAQWRKQVKDDPELQGADQFYREFSSGHEPGKKMENPGAVAAYTWDWPEFDHWLSYRRSDNDKEDWKYYKFPQDSWKQEMDGVVYFRSRPIYMGKGKGSYEWSAEFSRGSGTSWDTRLTINFELWDQHRIWKSHWIQPKLYDYKKTSPTRAASVQDWDNLNPDFLDSMDFDQKMKDRLLKSAEKFVERLSQVVQIDRIRWNVPGKFVPESMDFDPEEFGDVASRQAQHYPQVLKIFMDTYRRFGGDTGPDEDEACWRVLLTQIGASDDAIADRARMITEAGYEVLRQDIEPSEGWQQTYYYLLDHVKQRPLVSEEMLWALKRLFMFRYTDEDNFIDQAMAGKVTEAKQPSTKGFEQISGDFGSPWDYGGTWVDQEGNLVHFPGLDREDSKDVETSDTRIDSMLVPADYKLIVGHIHLDDMDKWENVEEEVRQRYADQITASRKFTVYRTTVEDDAWLERDWAREIAEIKAETEQPDEDWAKNPPAIKQAAIADRIGWEEFDHYPEKYTKAELSSLLGIDL